MTRFVTSWRVTASNTCTVFGVAHDTNARPAEPAKITSAGVSRVRMVATTWRAVTFTTLMESEM
jgi:hypothetical protein